MTSEIVRRWALIAAALCGCGDGVRSMPVPAAPGPTAGGWDPPRAWMPCGTLGAGGVRRLAYSPDGAVLAVGYGSGAVELHRASDRAVLRTVEAHRGPVTALAFDPAGRFLASAAGSEVRLWRTDTGTQAGGLIARATVDALAVSPGAELVIAAREVWHASDATRLLVLEDVIDQAAFVDGTAAFGDGGTAVVTVRGAQIRFLGLDGREWRRATLPSVPAFPRLSPDGRWLAGLLRDPSDPGVAGRRALWRILDGTLVWAAPGLVVPDSFAAGPVFSTDSSAVAFLSADAAELRDLADGTVRAHLQLPGAYAVASMAAPATGTVLSGVGQGWRIDSYGFAEQGELPRFQTTPGPGDYLFDLAVSRDGRLVASTALLPAASGGQSPHIWVWDIGERRVVRTFSGSDSLVLGTTFTDQSDMVAWFGDGPRVGRLEDGVAWVPDLGGDLQIASLRGLPDFGGVRMAFQRHHDDEWTLVALSGADSIFLREGSLGPPISSGRPPDPAPRLASPLPSAAVAISDDRALLAAAGVSLWTVADRALVWTHPQERPPPSGGAFDPITSWIRFSPDGKSLVTSICRLSGCGAPGGMVLRTNDGGLVRPIAGGRNPVFSPDGALVVAGAVVTDLASGDTQVLPVASEVSAFAPDGSILAADLQGRIQMFCTRR
jgi:WD40 repeat protein